MENFENELVSLWGDQAYSVIKMAKREYQEMDIGKFLDKCIACGGDWGTMLLTGVKYFYPRVWEEIPNDMGHNAFLGICYTLKLCGVQVET